MFSSNDDDRTTNVFFFFFWIDGGQWEIDGVVSADHDMPGFKHTGNDTVRIYRHNAFDRLSAGQRS